MTTRYSIGTSGWHYRHWRGDFYPEELDTGEWLAYYARQFETVEINNSFYQLPKDDSWRQWRESVPARFCFAVKASRYITHVKRLKADGKSFRRFYDAAERLEGRLGPVLYQLPPSFHHTPENEERLREFAERLPSGLDHAIEFRHKSWYTEGALALVAECGLAFCIHDMPGLETPVRATEQRGYLRFHGAGEKYGGRYTDASLAAWARRIRALDFDHAYIYFNNDTGGHAPRDAMRLREMLD